MIVPRKTARAMELATQRMVRVTPTRWVPSQAWTPPDLVLCRWERHPDNKESYHPVPIDTGRMVSVCEELAEVLGMGPSTRTLRRLINSGYIDGARVAPSVYLMSMDSWAEHLKRCAENPDMWDEPKHKQHYAQFI